VDQIAIGKRGPWGLARAKLGGDVATPGQTNGLPRLRLVERARRSRQGVDKITFEALWRLAVKRVCAKKQPQHARAKSPKERSGKVRRV